MHLNKARISIEARDFIVNQASIETFILKIFFRHDHWGNILIGPLPCPPKIITIEVSTKNSLGHSKIKRGFVAADSNSPAVMIRLKYELIGKILETYVLNTVPRAISLRNVLGADFVSNPLLNGQLINKDIVERVTIMKL